MHFPFQARRGMLPLALAFANALLVSADAAVTASTVTVYEYPECTPGAATISSATATAPTSEPTVTLVPAIHWDHDLTDLGNLCPQTNSSMYYAEMSGVHDYSIASQFGQLAAGFSCPTVILDHSSFIQSTTCNHLNNGVTVGTTEIIVQFNDPTAYKYAKGQWSSQLDLVLVTATPTCGESGDGQNAFWQVTSYVWNDSLLLVIVTAVEIDISTSITQFDFEWGTHLPTSNSSTNAAGSTNAANAANAASSTNAANAANAANGTCGTPPSATINGFPAAACGTGFDQALDNALGYFDFSDAAFSSAMAAFAPGLDDFSQADYADRKLKTRDIEKRWNPFKAIKHAFQKAVAAVKKAVTKVANIVAKAVVTAAKAVAKAVVTVLKTPFSPSMTQSFNVDLEPGNLVQSPFGTASKLIHINQPFTGKTVSGDATIYCKDCGVKTSITIKGRASFNIIDGLTAATISMNGNLYTGLFVGIDADLLIQKSFEKILVQKGLPFLSIPKIISIGPVVTVKAEVEVDVKAVGTLLVGASMNIPNFAATLDLVHPSSSTSSGFTPQFAKKFAAQGELDVTVTLALPVSIGIGLVIPIVKLDREAAIVNKPYITGEATFSGGVSFSKRDAPPCPNGIGYDIHAGHDIYFDLFGVKQYPLFSYTSPPFLNGCYSFKKSSSSSSTRSSTTTRSTTTSSTSSTSLSTSTSSRTSSSPSTTTTSSRTTTSSSSTSSSVPTTTSSSTLSVFYSNTTSSSTTLSSSSTSSSIATTTSSSTMSVFWSNTTSSTSPSSTSTTSLLMSTSSSTTSTSSSTSSSSSFMPFSPTASDGPDNSPPAQSLAERESKKLDRRQDSASSSTQAGTDTDDPAIPFDQAFPAPLPAAATTSADASAATDYPVTDADFSTLDNDAPPAGSLPDLTPDNSTLPASGDTSSDNSTYISLVDLTSSFQILADADGNFYITSASAPSGVTFESVENVTGNDDQGRIFHYYPATMDAFGVSRFRLSTQDMIPKTSAMLTLTPLDYDNDPSTPEVLLGVDTNGNVLYPIVCQVDGQVAKVFLANDVDQGPQILQQQNLSWIITGGNVTECTYLPIMAVPAIV